MSLSMYLAFAVLSLLQISDVFSDDTSFSGDGFYVGMKKVSRSRALRECKEKSMKLVSIQNEDKNVQIGEFLNEHDIDNPVWTSGIKISEHYWDWLNEEMIYTNWGSGEPNNLGEDSDCVEVTMKDNDVFWNDQSCKDERGYICEDISPLDSPNSSQIKVYHFSRKVATRDEAVTKCREMSMELASIKNEDENDDIYLLLKKKGREFPYWTSGYRPARYTYTVGFLQALPPETWLWLNEVPMEYFNWGEDEPDGEKGYKMCIEVLMKNSEVLWSDLDCSEKRKFICEKEN